MLNTKSQDPAAEKRPSRTERQREACRLNGARPCTPSAHALIETAARAWLGIRRALALEKKTLNDEIARERSLHPHESPASLLAIAFRRLAGETRTLDALLRFEARFERPYCRAIARLQRLSRKNEICGTNLRTDAIGKSEICETNLTAGKSPGTEICETNPGTAPGRSEICETNLSPGKSHQIEFCETNPPKTVGVERLRSARSRTGKSLVAIGGITRDNALICRDSGAGSVAIIADLYPNPCTQPVLRDRMIEWHGLSSR